MKGALEFEAVILNFNRDSGFHLMLADLISHARFLCISQACPLVTYLDASVTHIA